MNKIYLTTILIITCTLSFFASAQEKFFPNPTDVRNEIEASNVKTASLLANSKEYSVKFQHK